MADPGPSRGGHGNLFLWCGDLPSGQDRQKGGGGGGGGGGGRFSGFAWPLISKAAAIAPVAVTKEEKTAAVADAPDVVLEPVLKKGLAPPAQTDQNIDKMISGVTMEGWTCLNFSPMHPGETQKFCEDLIHKCNAAGMDIDPNPFVEIKSAAPDHIENAFRDLHTRTSKLLGKQRIGNQLVLFLIVILPDVGYSYENIERHCETNTGIVPQYCKPEHASKPHRKYLEDVALEIKNKVGMHRNRIFLEQSVVRDGTPFIITKDPPGEDSAPPITVVASMNWPEKAKYGRQVPTQLRRQEIKEDLFAVRKAAHGIVVDQKICHPTEFDSNLCGHADFQKDINGATVSNVGSPCRKRKETIQLVTVNKNDTAEFDDVALKTSAVQIGDCCFRIENYPSNNKSTFEGSCLPSLKSRAPGGWSGVGTNSVTTGSSSSGKRPNMVDYIQRLKEKKDHTWLEKVTIPPSLRRAEAPVIEYTVSLGDDGTSTLSKLLGCLEKMHKKGFCFDDLLDVQHILYSEAKEEFKIEGVSLSRLTQTGYQNNLKVIVKAIDAHFRYEDGKGNWKYPMYVEDLVKKIQDVNTRHGSCFSNKERYLIYKHLATWSPTEVISMFTLVVMKANDLTGHERGDFLKAIEKDVGTLNWQKYASDQAAPSVMKAVYNYSIWNPELKKCVKKTYQPTLYSWADFARCMLTHAQKYKVTLKQILSALWIMSPGRTSLLQRRITFYEPQKRTSSSATSGSVGFTANASGIPVRNALAGHQLVWLPKSLVDSDCLMKLV